MDPERNDVAASPSRAGRNVPVSIASGLVLIGAVLACLAFWKTAFAILVAAVFVVAIWEIDNGFKVKGIRLPQPPLMAGSAAMILSAYFWGTDAMVIATALTALLTLLWLLRRGVDGFVRDATASLFALLYLPFLASFVALLLSEGGRTGGGFDDDGVRAVIAFVGVTIASDIGGFVAGVLFGKHKMTPVISPKKSWEGFAGSVIACGVVGWLLVTYLVEGDWWVGVLLGLAAAVTATLGDLVESVIKRDLGIKDMSQIIPGHGGIMDRLDSLLATVTPAWLLLHFLVFT